MIDTVLYDWIYDNFSLAYDFFYGSAEQATGKYGVMTKISDLERPETLCNFQGDTGRALFQFSFWAGGSIGADTNAVETLQMAEDFKNKLKLLRGVIGTTEQYRIENNMTEGARIIGVEGYQTWGAIVESNIWWTKL